MVILTLIERETVAVFDVEYIYGFVGWGGR